MEECEPIEEELKQRSASGAPAPLLILSLLSVILRLRSGRDRIGAAAARALLETCATAALPLYKTLEDRAAEEKAAAEAAAGEKKEEEGLVPPKRGDKKEEAKVAGEGEKGERKGELQLMFDLLGCVMWGAAGALSQSVDSSE